MKRKRTISRINIRKKLHRPHKRLRRRSFGTKVSWAGSPSVTTYEPYLSGRTVNHEDVRIDVFIDVIVNFLNNHYDPYDIKYVKLMEYVISVVARLLYLKTDVPERSIINNLMDKLRYDGMEGHIIIFDKLGDLLKKFKRYKKEVNITKREIVSALLAYASDKNPNQGELEAFNDLLSESGYSKVVGSLREMVTMQLRKPDLTI